MILNSNEKKLISVAVKDKTQQIQKKINRLTIAINKRSTTSKEKRELVASKLKLKQSIKEYSDILKRLH